jgi:hypothetical protein
VLQAVDGDTGGRQQVVQRSAPQLSLAGARW